MKIGALLVTVIVTAAAVAGYMFQRQIKLTDHEAVVSVPPDSVLPRPTPMALTDVIGRQRPDFTLPDVSGMPHSVAEWDGSVITINFWATWCLPCLKEIPELVALQARYGSGGLQVVGIALQRPEELGEFIIEQKMNYPVLAGEALVIAVAEEFGNIVGVLPYTAIVNRTGEIVFVKAGAVTREEVETVIKELL